MNRTCKHKFRPGCEDLEGRQLLSSASTVLRVTPTLFGALNNHHLTNKQHSQKLQADFVVQDSGVPGFLYEAAVVSVGPGSPLLTVAPTGSTTTTSLNPGDRILSLDGLAVNKDGSNLEDHGGLTAIAYAQAGSNVVQTGYIII
jgi:hypothetical protein